MSKPNGNELEEPRRTAAQKRRDATLYRDREECANCKRRRKDVKTIDADHNVPVGNGGANILSNHNALCRECHDAKDNDGKAPTIAFKTTGRMTEEEFDWFEHFCQDLLPAMSSLVGPELVTIDPLYNLEGQKATHVPLGELITLARNKEIREVPGYRSRMVADFM